LPGLLLLSRGGSLSEIVEEGPLEVHWMQWPATERTAFEHKFEPAKKSQAESR